MPTMCSREIFTKKCRQQQIFDSDLKGAWHYNHVTFTPIAKNFMLYCRLIYMLSILCVRLTTKVRVGIPESLKVGWYPPKKTGSSHLNERYYFCRFLYVSCQSCIMLYWNYNVFTILAKSPWKTYARPFPSAMLRCDYNVTWLQQHCKRKEERETKGAEFSKVFQGFCLRL